MQPLPIDPLLPDVVSHLTAAGRLVLRAPPGAGKTTRVPAALLDAALAGDKQIVVLEPRRIAARTAAEFVARERGSAVGSEIGYRVRFEQRGGRATRLWFVTEGVLGRQLTRDPFLENVGIVVLDEFHERHLQGDVALAVLRELQETVRPDLKMVVMSATLETEPLRVYLGDCPVLTSEGRLHPVEVDYNEAEDRPLAARVAEALRRVLDRPEGGDVLVFLPGAAEIRRAAAAIESLAAGRDLDVVPLHGDLPLDVQQRAILPGRRRKVILSTNVAETALTVEGVTCVIDSGLARVARIDPRHGINTLRVARISRASAEQRAGRAGRTAPGRCVRLWARGEHAALRERETPEVLRLDLSPTLLELRAWGLRDLDAFRWLDAPSEAAVQRAESLLRLLGAVDAVKGEVTPTGRRMLDLAVHPRLARILVEAERTRCQTEGALLAALASERDICLEGRTFTGDGPADGRHTSGDSDLILRMQLFEEAARRGLQRSACQSLDLDARTVHAVERTRRQLTRVLDVERRHRGGEPDVDTLLRCVLAGFPDRVVRRRAPGSPRGLMTGGTGVALVETSIVREPELFVAVDVEAGGPHQHAEARVRLASAVRKEWLLEMFPQAVQTASELVFDDERERVVERERELYEDLVLAEVVRLDVDRGRAGQVLAAAAQRQPERAVRLGPAERGLLGRLGFLRVHMPELGLPVAQPLFMDAIEHLCVGKVSFAELGRADLMQVMRGLLTSAQLRALEREAPERYRLPTGRTVAVSYETDKPPVVAARIQELFGLTATPRLAGGRVPLVVQLLAPNQRPVQVTDDLESFWRRTYLEVRKQLRGRYPKHDWPEDPLDAQPTGRIGKRRGV